MLILGVLYAAIRFGTAAAHDHFGASGLYTVAALSGLTDMDAITLSPSQFASGEQSDTGTAWGAILIASMTILILFGVTLLAGSAILWLWPQ